MDKKKYEIPVIEEEILILEDIIAESSKIHTFDLADEDFGGEA